MINYSKRVRFLNKHKFIRKGPVVYWMGRDQRSNDNWALLYAQSEALKLKAPLHVVFCLVPSFLGAAYRQYHFMIEGLKEVEKNLMKKNIGFHLLFGNPQIEIPRFLGKMKAGLLITDFEPLKIKANWKLKTAKKIKIPFHEVDARNIIPCWMASPKQEFGAYTIRGKIHRLLDEYVTAYPQLKKHPCPSGSNKINWDNAYKKIRVDKKVLPVKWIKPGESAALKTLRHFINNKLARYPDDRNNPVKDGQSNLSPYLHFGQISSLTVVNEVMRSDAPRRSKDDFLEELIVRRELSDNFCFYNVDYDNLNGIPDWAAKTFSHHRKDRRKYIYSLRQLEDAKTHDEAWNAAQREMVSKGKMHGYMRMYWAKKILEWTPSAQTAVKYAIYLNDKYELDGRDSNGYTGIMWSICGVHDRAWNERPIFGKIRYMSYDGLKNKFDIKKYIEQNKDVT